MSNPAQRTFTLSILDFNAQKRSTIFNNSNDDDKIKINKFDLYYENRVALENWFTQMKIYLLFNSVEKDRKTLFMFIFLRKRTERWLKSSLCKKLDENKNKKKIFVQFSEFKKEIRRIFEVSNKEQIAKWVIQHLIQKTSINDYAARFQKHVNLIDWNDVVKMIMYR